MPKITKTKKKNVTNLPAPVKTTKKKTSVKKHSAIDYYNCLLTQAQNDWFDPQTGQKKKIAACCKDCKNKAPILNQHRQAELEKLITSYKQVGDSLSRLLKPIN